MGSTAAGQSYYEVVCGPGDGAVLEADWSQGSPVRVRHWPDRVSVGELEKLLSER